MYLPATHSAEHACGSLAALLKKCPTRQVLSVHAELSVSVEYLPDPHAAQAVSVEAVPAASPWPMGQFGVPWFAHGLAPSASLNLAPVHALHNDESALVAPSV